MGHWPTAVLPLTADIVRSGHALFFVESGGLGLSYSGPLVREACSERALLHVHEDHDLVVDAPPLPHNVQPLHDRFYYCCVPSLRNIERGVQAHDDAYGQSAVLLDEAHSLRPYWNVVQDLDQSPKLRLPEAEADQWRASDLLAFAESRAAPTMAVWDHPNDLKSGLDALLAVSLMHVAVLWTRGAQTVVFEVSRRARRTDPWPNARRLRVPVYDKPLQDGSVR